MAVILFDFSSTFTCPRTSRLAVAQALTLSMAALSIPWSCERRSTFPSIAISWPLITFLTVVIQRIKQAWNCSGSRRANTRVKVSCEGMPLGNSRNVWNHSILTLPNSSTSSQLSAPAIMAQMAMTRMSRSLCSLVRSMRGSVRSLKCCSILGITLSSIAYPLSLCNR